MHRPPAIAAAIAAVLWTATPVAVAQDVLSQPRLVAQIAQTQDEPAVPDDFPPLSDDVFRDDSQPPGDGTDGEEAEPLPATGSESALVALVGLGLLSAGFGLRTVAVRP